MNSTLTQTRSTEDLSNDQIAENVFSWMSQKYPRLYFAMAHHRTTDNEPMTFRDRPWLRTIYKDHASHQVFMKCVQVGVTEYCICDMFYLASMGVRGLYLLPDDGWVGLWVADRIDGLLERVPFYKAAVGRADKESDSRRLKSMFGSLWKFAGTHSKTAGGRPKHGVEFSAGALIIDEYDDHDPDDLQIFYDRLAAKKETYTRLLGNPTVDGKGIAAEFAKTDAKFWNIPCHCGHKQVLRWKDHFVQEIAPGIWEPRDADRMKETQDPEAPDYDNDLRPVCESCEEPFNRLKAGIWIPTNHNGARGSGYSISRTFISVKPDDIHRLYRKFIDAGTNQSMLQIFHNNWMGETYSNKDESITEELLRLCTAKSNNINREIQNTIAGVDQGAYFHVKISEVLDGITRTVWIGKLRTWEQVDNILDEFGVAYVGIDAQGGGYNETREFVKNRDGAYMIYYRPVDQVRKLYDDRDADEEESGVIAVNRTESLDAMVASFQERRQIVPVEWATIDEGQFRKQMTNSQRILDPRGRPIWTKGNDHYFHATNYENIVKIVSGIKDSRQEQYTSWRV